MRKRLGLLLVATFAGAVCLAARTQPAPAPRDRSAPEYDSKGELKRPTDFRTWVFVGADLGVRYHKDGARESDRPKNDRPGEFHNVYIRPESYEHYLKTGKFPDRTVLVMEVFEARDRDAKGIVAGGFFPGAQRRVEVAVKNSKRPDGSKTDWAYYDFDQPTTLTAPAFRDATCYDCHLKHADVDNVWVQFYPALRDRAEKP